MRENQKTNQTKNKIKKKNQKPKTSWKNISLDGKTTLDVVISYTKKNSFQKTTTM